MSDENAYERARKRAREKYTFYTHLVVYVAVNLFLIAVNLFTSPQSYWFIWPLLGWGVAVVIHGARTFLLSGESATLDRMTKRELENEDPRFGRRE